MCEKRHTRLGLNSTIISICSTNTCVAAVASAAATANDSMNSDFVDVYFGAFAAEVSSWVRAVFVTLCLYAKTTVDIFPSSHTHRFDAHFVVSTINPWNELRARIACDPFMYYSFADCTISLPNGIKDLLFSFDDAYSICPLPMLVLEWIAKMQYSVTVSVTNEQMPVYVRIRDVCNMRNAFCIVERRCQWIFTNDTHVPSMRFNVDRWWLKIKCIIMTLWLCHRVQLTPLFDAVRRNLYTDVRRVQSIQSRKWNSLSSSLPLPTRALL